MIRKILSMILEQEILDFESLESSRPGPKSEQISRNFAEICCVRP